MCDSFAFVVLLRIQQAAIDQFVGLGVKRLAILIEIVVAVVAPQGGDDQAGQDDHDDQDEDDRKHGWAFLA